jgi:hypothetical protein
MTLTLMQAAEAAWRDAPRRARKVRFTWNGRRYTATHSTFALCVQDSKGNPVIKKYL